VTSSFPPLRPWGRSLLARMAGYLGLQCSQLGTELLHSGLECLVIRCLRSCCVGSHSK
jgi:hypothetical protein